MPCSLTGQEQLKELQETLDDWRKGPPLKPVLFVKVGSQDGVKNWAGGKVRKQASFENLGFLQSKLWKQLTPLTSQPHCVAKVGDGSYSTTKLSRGLSGLQGDTTAVVTLL